MKPLRTTALSLFLSLVGLIGCTPQTPMPTALPVAQLPAALQKAFLTAPPETRDLANQLVAAIEAKDYSRAHALLEVLSAAPNLTREQLEVTARGLLTLNELLQAAQAQGDPKAAQTLENYHRSR